MRLAELITTINSAVNHIVWGVPAIILILGLGLWVTIGNGAVQFRHFGWAMKHTLGTLFQQSKTTDKGAITPLQAVTTALAATLGTGNVAGVAGAITLGGPGAIFWMWVAALLGMGTKYCEIVLAVNFRVRNKEGEWAGGPMYYIRNGLGENWAWLAALFSALAVLASFGIGNMTQMNTVANQIVYAAQTLAPAAAAVNERSIRIATGICGMALLAFVLLGGIKRIGATTERLIPFMSVFYTIGACVIVFANLDRIGPAFQQIFACAFGGKAVLGGAFGFTFSQAIHYGCARGIFSNEAGLGSAPIAHATADTKGPVHQGLYGILEVFLDTIVICTLTALVILMSGSAIPYGQSADAALTTAGFATVFGTKFTAIFMAITLACFAISTAIGWSLYGSRCLEYLFGSKAVRPYQLLFVCMPVIGATIDLQLAWDIADALNGLMSVPNLIALVLLAPLAFQLTRKYFLQAKAGVPNEEIEEVFIRR